MISDVNYKCTDLELLAVSVPGLKKVLDWVSVTMCQNHKGGSIHPKLCALNNIMLDHLLYVGSYTPNSNFLQIKIVLFLHCF